MDRRVGQYHYIIRPLDTVAVRRVFIFSLHLILYIIVQTKRNLLKMDDALSSLPFLKPGLQTPGANKRLRSNSDEGIDDNPQLNLKRNDTPNKNSSNLQMSSSNHQMTSSNQNDYPPIIIEFKNKHDKPDRKLVEELVKEWKCKNNKNINVIGRFGFKNNLLIFARDSSTLDDLLEKSQWPNRIEEMEFAIKFPTRLPDSYSLVVQDFQLSWKEIEVMEDLQERHSSLLKLTRLMARNGKPLRAVRADFSSSNYVKHLISLREIELNYMKLQVRPYYSPVKINKCRKCFRHDHFTNQCTSKQLCIRCGGHHSFENGCHNEIKCVNCQQGHYSGHSSCPVVQEKRKHVADQQKVHRAQMLIHQQQAFDFNNSMFPPLSSQQTSHPPRSSSNLDINIELNNNRQSYLSATTSKTKVHENVEQMVFALSNSINSQLANISATLTTQIADLAAKIDGHKQKTLSVEYQIREAIIPAIQELAKVIDDLRQQKSINVTQQTYQQSTSSSCSEMVKYFFADQQHSSFNTPRSKKPRQRNNATQIQTNILNKS